MVVFFSFFHQQLNIYLIDNSTKILSQFAINILVYREIKKIFLT